MIWARLELIVARVAVYAAATWLSQRAMSDEKAVERAAKLWELVTKLPAGKLSVGS